MHAPLSFFETTPTGRCVGFQNHSMILSVKSNSYHSILNLFSRDTYVVDQILGRVIQNMVRTSAVCASIVLVIGFSFPPFLIAVIPLAWFYYRVTMYECFFLKYFSSAMKPVLARPFLHGSQNPWRGSRPSGPTTNNPSSLPITRAELIATSYATYQVLPLTAGLQ
jgi:ABC-type multidrug transport system fused ATPase/permease subunit